MEYSLFLHRRSPLLWPKGVQNLVVGAGLMLSGWVVWDGMAGIGCYSVVGLVVVEGNGWLGGIEKKYFTVRCATVSGSHSGKVRVSEIRPGQTRSYKELFPDGLGGEGNT